MNNQIELIKAAEEHLHSFDIDGMPITRYAWEDMVRAFIDGAQWQKEQMMKEAVDADVNYFECTPGDSYVEFAVDVPKPSKYSDKEKVKIIIVKEDEQ